YRPWSRELHYWTLQRLAGARETAFHLTSFSLWITALALYYAYARRLSRSVAAVALLGVAGLAAWGVLVLWIAGAQDLWMLVFALGSLLALASGKRTGSAVLYAAALLSKETAAVVY